mmetsp:Transcript_265/g.383  ORF Transcript_265/g.383 Transcript_265/m.383 type:complete len:126 (-) Transcript_265:344-721(-)
MRANVRSSYTLHTALSLPSTKSVPVLASATPACRCESGLTRGAIDRTFSHETSTSTYHENRRGVHHSTSAMSMHAEFGESQCGSRVRARVPTSSLLCSLLAITLSSGNGDKLASRIRLSMPRSMG